MIKTDFQLEYDPSVIFDFVGKSVEKKLKDPSNTDVMQRMEKRFFDLITATVIWNRIKIEEYQHEKVVLAGGHKIGNGPFIEVVSGARELVVAVCTVGRELESTAKELMKSGAILEGIILDGLASWAVDSLRCNFYRWASEVFAETEGFRSSTYLCPGESIWSIDDQRVIFQILSDDIPDETVTLTDSNVMVPFKSLSMCFGIGPDVMGSEGQSNCDLCTMRDTCRFKKLRAS
jgi:hypothetical protein